eukprot:evm.model.NODE_32214_length_3973_cov_33.808708.2
MKAVEEKGEGGKEREGEGRKKVEKEEGVVVQQAVLQSDGKQGKGEGGKEGEMKGKSLDSGKLVEKEAVGRGSVGASVYRAYIRW